MYLVLKDNEKIIIENVNELENIDLSNCKVYSCALLDTTELLFDKDIRDCIYNVLKGKEMPPDQLVQSVQNSLDVPVSRIRKVVTKMKKEKIIFCLEDTFDLEGHRYIGILE